MAGINSSKRHRFLFVFLPLIFLLGFFLVWILWWLPAGPRSCFRKRKEKLLWKLGIAPLSPLEKLKTLFLEKKVLEKYVPQMWLVRSVQKCWFFFMLPEWGLYLVMNNIKTRMGPWCSVISCGIIKYWRQMGSQGLSSQVDRETQWLPEFWPLPVLKWT